MGLKNIVGRLNKYQQRLEKGKAEKIQQHHIDKAIDKLEAKEALLRKELEDTEKADKRKRLKAKISTIREQIQKARWLSEEI